MTGRRVPALLLVVGAIGFSQSPRPIRWVHLSSRAGELPAPGDAPQQTGLLVANLDRTAAAGLVVSFRVKAPALTWIRRIGGGWQKYVIEPDFLTVEAGGAAYDIDGDSWRQKNAAPTTPLAASAAPANKTSRKHGRRR